MRLQLFICIVVLLLSFPARADIPPPELVHVQKTSQKVALKGFVVDFYRWYNFEIDREAQMAPQENSRLNLNLKEYLSPRFSKNLQKLTDETDADPILCTQDGWDRANDSNIDVKFAKTNQNKAELLVKLPFNSDNQRRVELQIVQGVWRINGVKCLQ